MAEEAGASGDGGQATIAAVIARLVSVGSGLAPDDGVARFNDLYLSVTQEAADRTETGTFEDPRFLVTLDVAFANLYFSAVESSERGDGVPRAWAPLFEARARSRIAPVQFALAGMNAHINHDLCLALVETCDRLDLGLDPGSAQHRDYLKVNAILERVEDEVKKRLATGVVAVADEALGRLDDVVAMWSVARARDAAWTHAETLSSLQAVPGVADGFLAALDRMVGLAGRGLLIPTL